MEVLGYTRVQSVYTVTPIAVSRPLTTSVPHDCPSSYGPVILAFPLSSIIRLSKFPKLPPPPISPESEALHVHTFTDTPHWDHRHLESWVMYC